jgi:CO/xanthine dehydrogenase FAD-binding subunit
MQFDGSIIYLTHKGSPSFVFFNLLSAAQQHYAARRNGTTAGSVFFDACHKSYFVCLVSHESSLVFVSNRGKSALTATDMLAMSFHITLTPASFTPPA